MRKYGILCGISSANNDFGTKILTFIIHKALIFFIGVIVTLTCYILTIKRIQQIQKIFLAKNNLKTGRFLLYPALLFAIFLPYVVHSFLRLAFNFRSTLFEAVLILGTHSLGFMNALVYGFERKLHATRVSPEKTEIEFRTSTTCNQSLNWDEVKKNLE